MTEMNNVCVIGHIHLAYKSVVAILSVDQLAYKRTFRSHYAHTPSTEPSKGPMDTVTSILSVEYAFLLDLSKSVFSLMVPYISKWVGYLGILPLLPHSKQSHIYR